MGVVAVLVNLIPALVTVAEKLFPTGPEKKAWVVGMVQSMMAYAEKRSPAWASEVEKAVEPLVEALIEAAVQKLP